jgi:hypothetical protein
VKRTGASFFFDLDVTHLRSADAMSGMTKSAKSELVSLEQSTQAVKGTSAADEPVFLQSLGYQWSATRIFTIF